MSDEIGIRLKRIRGKLKQVQRIKPVGFGWESHRYRLNPPLKEGLLTDFEQTHGVTLPTEFRRFVIEVGDGGAGPAYGLQSYKNWGQWRSRTGNQHRGLEMPDSARNGRLPAASTSNLRYLARTAAWNH